MAKSEHNGKLISVVIPCYNEEGNIEETVNSSLEILKDHDFEIICVNDGSKDDTWGKIKSLAERHSSVKAINLMRNHEMTQAYMAGFDESKGNYVLIMSADLEIPVENLKKVIHYLDEGYDFVNTHRKDRWGKASRSLPSKVANILISKISGVSMQDTGSGMKGFTRTLIECTAKCTDSYPLTLLCSVRI